MSLVQSRETEAPSLGLLETEGPAVGARSSVKSMGETRLPSAAPPQVCDSVLCFGDSDWWYHNRGHADMQFMRRFAKQVPVLYVNSLGVATGLRGRGNGLFRRGARKLRSMARYYRDGGEGFRVLSPIYLPGLKGAGGRFADRVLTEQIQFVRKSAGVRRPLIWVACPTAARVLHNWPNSPVVYQLSDCYSALWGGASSRAASFERQLAERADLVICSSRRLLERARDLYGCGEYVDHGVDFELFSNVSKTSDRGAPLQALRRPIVGFFGNLDENTVDAELLDRVIASRPKYSFVLVGAMARGFETLRRHANVAAVGQKPYGEIPHYGAHFDVCIMPWQENEWIQHCNPVKLKEYLALGKPVVSTPFPELKTCGDLCRAARGSEEFASAIDEALRSDTPELHARRRAWASRHTWEQKFDTVMEHLSMRGIYVG